MKKRETTKNEWVCVREREKGRTYYKEFTTKSNIVLE